MAILQYLFSGLVGLIMDQLAAHKSDIETLLTTFLKQLLDALINSGHHDLAGNIKAAIGEHE